MAVRIKDGEVPYTGGIGIEITNNHVINVLLRELNNLIHVNENRELYVDLQLDDGITPEDSLPVGVTTGRILQEDGRPQSGTILNWKTTSGDQVSLIYANDDCLYYSVNGGAWRLLGGGDGELSNVRAFYLEDLTDLTNGQLAYDWYADDKMPIVSYNNDTYVMESYYEEDGAGWIRLIDTRSIVYHQLANGVSYVGTNKMYIRHNDQGEVTTIDLDIVQISPTVIDTSTNYQFAYSPTQGYNPATKQYVDDGLATKQDILTAGTNITIDQNNVISATMPSALVYKGNVQTVADLPSSGQTVGDTYFVEGVDGMYSWDGTQWNYVGSTSPSLTNYFNKTVDDSDDITEGSIHLFCTNVEKNYWNSKQDALTAGDNINIDANNVISSPSYVGSDYIAVNNHVISNLKPFIPENDGALGQVLKKTSTGYEWKNDSSNFNPENAGSTGQVLKKTETGYAWANESGGGGGGGGTSYNAGYGINITGHTISNTKPFDPEAGGSAGDVLIKTADGYEWGSVSGSGNVRLFTVNSNTSQAIDLSVVQDAFDWYKDDKLPVIRAYTTITRYNESGVSTSTTGYFDFYPEPTSISNMSGQGIVQFFTIHNRENNSMNVTMGYTEDRDNIFEITHNGTDVTLAQIKTQNNSQRNYLSTTENYSNPYQPQHAGSPATKDYVDSRNWVGTQAQYDLLPSTKLTDGVIYNIIPSS